MTDMWLGYAESSGRREVLMALRKIAPGSAVMFADSAGDLRQRLVEEEEPGTIGVIVGHTGEDVSDMNLAAAIVHDGRASEVVLVARGASGSLRSRARRAGIARVVDATVAPVGSLPVAALPMQDDAAPTGDAGGSRAEVVGGDAVPDAASAAAGVAEVPVAPATDGALDDGAQSGGSPTQSDGALRPESPSDGAEPSPNDVTVVDEPRPKDVAPILTVASGRGGVGKTALVALMASVAARWGMDVAVVDLDLSCGNLHTCFGVPKGPDLARIVVDDAVTAESMGRASVRCAEHLHLWGPCERPEMAEVVMPHVATLLSYLSSRHDLVLVDTSTTFTDAVAQSVQSCDRLLVVHDERAGAVSSAARMSALAVRLGVARTRIVRVISLADPRAKVNAFEGRAEVGLETARMHRVVDGGIEAEELLTSGKVGELASTDSQLTVCVGSLLAQTLAELGRLPDNELARKASESRARRHGLRLFGGQRREAV